jgi:hypothetical protein
MAIVNEATVFCHSGTIDGCPTIKGASKIVADPLDPSQFFVQCEEAELRLARLKDGEVQHRIVEKGVDDFDVSKKFLLIVRKGTASLYARQDSAVRPLFQKNLAARSRVFIDDEFFYEFLPKSQTLYVFVDGHPVQLVKQIANVYKSQEVVIQYVDGNLSTVGRPLHEFESPPIAAVADGEKLIAWFTIEEQPIVIEIDKVECPLVRRFAHLISRMKNDLQQHQASILEKTEAIAAEYGERIEIIKESILAIERDIPDSAFYRCLRFYETDDDANLAFSTAVDDGVDCFTILAGRGRLLQSIQNGKLNDQTLIKILVPLSQVISSDVAIWAPLAYEVMLTIDDKNAGPRANFEQLKTVVDDVLRQGTQAAEAESLLHTLKLVSRILLSFLEGD